MVEQRPEKPRVRSSILRLGTILSLFITTHNHHNVIDSSVWQTFFHSSIVHSLSNNPICSIFSPGNGTGYAPSKQAEQ